MYKSHSIIAFALAGLCCAVPALAANPTININAYTLLPDTANQVIPIYVTGAVGGTAVQGIDLYAQTGDGGTAVGGTAGPLITSVDLKPPGSLFGSISDLPSDPGSVPQVAVRDLAYLSGGSGASVFLPDSNTLLLNLTIDTTNIFTGTYDLQLSNVLAQYNTDFGPVPIDITNGSITVSSALPEPASMMLLVMGTPATMFRRRRTLILLDGRADS